MTNGISYRSFNLKNFWPILLLLIVGGVIFFLMLHKPPVSEEGVELKEIFESQPETNEGELKENTEVKEVAVPAPRKKNPDEPVVTKAADQNTPTQADKASKPFTIQVASFKEQSTAKKFLEEIKKKDHPAYIESRDLKEKGTYWRIYVGAFETKTQADEYLKNLLSDYKGSFVVVR